MKGRQDACEPSMTTISSLNSAALLILQQTNRVSPAGQDKSGSDDLVAVANGLGTKVGATRQPSQAQAKISQAMFSVNDVNITKLKLELIDRTGKALGVDPNDFVSRDEFVDAMQKAFLSLKSEGGTAAVMGLEKKLGLDKLGVSIEDVIFSARNPDGNDKLTKALEKQAGKTKEKLEDLQTMLSQQPDEIGLYGTSKM